MTSGRQRGAARGSRAILASALAILFASSSGGCSFFKMKPAPPPSAWPDPVTPRSSELPCTSSLGPPIIDSVIAGTLGTLTYVERNSGSQSITVIFGVGTLPYLASAIYGYVHSARCRSYKSMFHAGD